MNYADEGFDQDQAVGSAMQGAVTISAHRPPETKPS